MLNQFSMSQPNFTSDTNQNSLNKLILIVDDNPNIFEELCQILTGSGWEIVTVKNTEAAIAEAQLGSPVLIILDLTSPKIKGIESCRYLKENHITRDVPVILITDSGDKETKVRCLEVGAVDYINYPIQAEEVLVRVKNHMTISKLQKQVRQQNLHLQHQMTIQNLITMMQEQICQSFNLEEILSISVREVRQFLLTDRVFIYQFEEDRSRVIAHDSSNSDSMSALGTIIKRTNERDKSQNPEGKYRDYFNHYRGYYQYQQKNQHNLMLPIRQGGKLWGMLIIENYSQPRSWQELEIDLLKQLVRQLGITIQQAELYQKLESVNQELHRLATLDSLTQLANRYSFNIYLSQEWRRLTRERSETVKSGKNRSNLSLIMCDVDFFKLYNDNYGHVAGDICLQQVAQAIKETVNRPADLVARYGGEEFAVILPNTDTEGAFHIAEQIRNKVKALQIPHAKSSINQYVTLSLGVSSIVPSGESSPEELIAVADRALYRAKGQGRDRTYIC